MVSWLVIGIGDITRKRVLPAILAEPRSRLHAVLTRDPRKAEAYPGVEAFTRLDQALSDPAIDAVYVASPVALHAEQAIAALRAGKQVLCEKPVALDLAQAEQMAAAARDPALAGGGPLYDVGSHRIDACNFLFGKPRRATGMLSNALHELAVEDSATVLIEYVGGVHAVVDVRWNSHIQRDQFRVIGVDGEISLDMLNGPALRLLDSRGNLREEHLPAHVNVHYPAVENFVAAVLDGAPLACPIDEAMWTDWVTQQVMHAQSTS